MHLTVILILYIMFQAVILWDVDILTWLCCICLLISLMMDNRIWFEIFTFLPPNFITFAQFNTINLSKQRCSTDYWNYRCKEKHAVLRNVCRSVCICVCKPVWYNVCECVFELFLLSEEKLLLFIACWPGTCGFALVALAVYTCYL